MNSLSAVTLDDAVHPASGAAVFAAGAWMHNSVCAWRGQTARLSAVAGDLDSPAACVAHEQMSQALLDWLGPPVGIAHDLHPNFHSSRHAAALAARYGVPALPVQHHHAHIGALCAEHGQVGPLLGLALDGVGLGSDNTSWGGELLYVDGAHFERLGHLAPLALPGADRAAREPWRMAASVLHALGRGAQIVPRFADEAAAATVQRMLEGNINCPSSSSAGRVFDAAAGLLGLSRRMARDAEAAQALEQAAGEFVGAQGWPAAQPELWRIARSGVLDLRPLLASLADERDAPRGAARFHATLVAALEAWAVRAAEARGISVVALGGGCFFNRLLSAGLRARLEAQGLTVLSARRVVCGDAAIALGQAWVARHALVN